MASNWRACVITWLIVTSLVLMYSLSGQNFAGNEEGGVSKQPPTFQALTSSSAEDSVKPSLTGAETTESPPFVASLFNESEIITRLTAQDCESWYHNVTADPKARAATTVPPIELFREHLNAIQAYIQLRTACFALLRKRIKGISTGRKVFIDMGSRKADSVTAFLKHYPQAKEYDIHCFEANSDFNQWYEGENKMPRVTYHNMAVSTVNGTLSLSDEDVGSSIVVKSADKEKHAKSKMVSTINWNEFLLRNFQPGDFIIVKMDIEKAEFGVLHLLLKSIALLHIDHLLLECHCSTYVPAPRPKRLAKLIGRDECKKMIHDMNDFGMVSIDWSKRRTAAEYARAHGKWYPT